MSLHTARLKDRVIYGTLLWHQGNTSLGKLSTAPILNHCSSKHNNKEIPILAKKGRKELV